MTEGGLRMVGFDFIFSITHSVTGVFIVSHRFSEFGIILIIISLEQELL
jgi:hypothetical protein